MSESPVVDRVHALITPILTDLGLVLYDLEFGSGVLKVTVDKAGGVDIDTLALATRLINRELDHSDPVPGKYTLEVSSPGIERPLRRPDHYANVIGSTVTVRLRDVTNEARRFQGTLVAADADGITVRLEDGTERTEPFHHIDRARTVFVWETAPKGGSKKKQNTDMPPTEMSGTDMEVSAS